MSRITRVKLIIVGCFIVGGGVLCTNNFITRPVGAFSAGPPAGHTGAPSEFTCDECHLKVGTSSGTFTVNAPQSYIPGQTYQIMVTHSSPDQTRMRWGFQLTALDGGDERAGNLQRMSSQGRHKQRHVH